MLAIPIPGDRYDTKTAKYSKVCLTMTSTTEKHLFWEKGQISPFLNKIEWQLCVFEDEHQLFLHEDSLQSIFQMVHHSITWTRHDFTQSVHVLRPYSIWLSCTGCCVLHQAAASNDTINPQAVCLLGHNFLHGPGTLFPIRLHP